MAKTPRKNYIENEEYREALIESHKLDRVSDKLLALFQLHIERQMREFKYTDEDDRHDIYSGTLCTALRKWKDCDVTREKPFAWFTRVNYNAIYHYWNKINKKNSVTVSISSIFEEQI